MLQLVTQGAAPAVAAPASEARPAQMSAEPMAAAEGALALGELFASELDGLAEQQVALLEALESASELPAEALALPEAPAQAAPELDAEQWLLSMLGQREVQLQARDTPAAQLQPAGVAAMAGMVAARAAVPMGNGLPVAHGHSGAADARVIVNPPAVDPLSSQVSAVSAPEATPVPAAQVKTDVPLPAPAKPLETALLAALEPLAGAAGTAPAETADGLAPASSSAAPTTPAAAHSIKLQGPEAKWGEQMLNALRDNVELQVQQRVQSTTIRLDPPELGSMEIFLSHESGRLNVQITASQADVARLLQSTSERLRQELVGQHFTQVSVGVATDSQSGQQHARQGRGGWLGEAEGAIKQAAEVAAEEKTGLNRDVLITV